MFRAQMMRVITGAVIRTAALGKRWELSSAPSNVLKAFSGLASESDYGYLSIDGETVAGIDYAGCAIASPILGGAGGARAAVFCSTEHAGGSSSSSIELDADRVQVDGPMDDGVGNTLVTHTSLMGFPALVGAGNADGKTLQMRYGSAVVVTNGSGDYTVGFPAVSNAVLTVLATVGDLVGAFTIVRGYTGNSFNGRAYNPGGAVHVGAFRVNFLVIGW